MYRYFLLFVIIFGLIGVSVAYADPEPWLKAPPAVEFEHTSSDNPKTGKPDIGPANGGSFNNDPKSWLRVTIVNPNENCKIDDVALKKVGTLFGDDEDISVTTIGDPTDPNTSISTSAWFKPHGDATFFVDVSFDCIWPVKSHDHEEGTITSQPITMSSGHTFSSTTTTTHTVTHLGGGAKVAGDAAAGTPATSGTTPAPQVGGSAHVEGEANGQSTSTTDSTTVTYSTNADPNVKIQLFNLTNVPPGWQVSLTPDMFTLGANDSKSSSLLSKTPRDGAVIYAVVANTTNPALLPPTLTLVADKDNTTMTPENVEWGSIDFPVFYNLSNGKVVGDFILNNITKSLDFTIKPSSNGEMILRFSTYLIKNSPLSVSVDGKQTIFQSDSNQVYTTLKIPYTANSAKISVSSLDGNLLVQQEDKFNTQLKALQISSQSSTNPPMSNVTSGNMTTPVPEFSVAELILILSIMSIVLISTRSKLSRI